MILLKKLDQLIDKLGYYAILISFSMLLILSVALIVFRWFGTAIMWADPLMRHLVFFSIFMGGVLATGKGTHIGIDLISKFLENSNRVKERKILLQITSLVTTGTLLWLTFVSVKFVQVEANYPKDLFFGISSEYMVAIIPIGFFMIAIRSVLGIFLNRKDS